MTGELIGNSPAMGCFVVVQCDERNSDHYRALSRSGDEGTVSATINVPSMNEIPYTVTVYDLEENGLPNRMPAVEVVGIIVSPHGKHCSGNVHLWEVCSWTYMLCCNSFIFYSMYFYLNICFHNTDKDEDSMNSTFLKRAEISKKGSEVTITCEFSDGYQEASCVLIYHEYNEPNLTVKVFNNSFYEFPVTITVDNPDKYTFSLFGKNVSSAIEQEPVIRIKMKNHATYPPPPSGNYIYTACTWLACSSGVL